LPLLNRVASRLYGQSDPVRTGWTRTRRRPRLRLCGRLALRQGVPTLERHDAGLLAR